MSKSALTTSISLFSATTVGGALTTGTGTGAFIGLPFASFAGTIGSTY